MRLPLAVAFLVPLAGAIAVASGYTAGEDRPGGSATSFKPRNASAFSHPSASLSFERQLDFKVGDGIFRKQWVSAPSSTESSDGLGPLFNARACQNCHLKDGRGRPPAPGETASSLLVKLSVLPRDEAERTALKEYRRASIGGPVYGGQLQTFAIQGLDAEGHVAIEDERVPVRFADGQTATLHRPRYRLTDLAYGPLDADTMISPRVAPPMIGMGLLELIPEADILARADPDDRDGDGIRGVAQRAWSAVHGRVMLGRFGWKATAPSVADQTANAFATDMGLSTPALRVSTGDCTQAQAICRKAPNGDDEVEGVEVTQTMFDLVVFYARNLAVPGRVNTQDATVLEGKRLFGAIGCAACHVPSQVTGADPEQPHLSGQTIWPYTDLLLHDMGDGLADGFPEGTGSGRHWRTPPLWGLGLTKTVSGHTRLLHDGRARDSQEAILWHGGEAQPAQERYRSLSKTERAALLAFLDSL
jgi:CxxC motif-containing protein (DUF1111 family)